MTVSRQRLDRRDRLAVDAARERQGARRTMARLPAWPPPYDPRSVGLVAAMVAALLLPPMFAYEPVWEVAAGLGYAGCAAAIAVFAVPPAPRPNLTAYRFAVHRIAGNALLALGILHVAVMTALDPYLLDYLGWMMPLHVILGVLALLAFLLAVATREPWLRHRLPLPAGAAFHAWTGIAGGALLAAHVLLSSTRLTASWRTAALAAALALPPAIAVLGLLGRRTPPRGEPTAPGGAGRFLMLALLGIFVLMVAVPTLVAGLGG